VVGFSIGMASSPPRDQDSCGAAGYLQLHAFVAGATAAFGDNPIDNLVVVGDVAGFAVDAIGGVDF
jgi:hypothetical protein